MSGPSLYAAHPNDHLTNPIMGWSFMPSPISCYPLNNILNPRTLNTVSFLSCYRFSTFFFYLNIRFQHLPYVSVEILWKWQLCLNSDIYTLLKSFPQNSSNVQGASSYRKMSRFKAIILLILNANSFLILWPAWSYFDHFNHYSVPSTCSYLNFLNIYMNANKKKSIAITACVTVVVGST